MSEIEKYAYSINFESSPSYDREHSPYFCNNETPKLPNQNSVINNSSFEFSQGFNPGLTLDKYFGGNFRVIQLSDMEIDETFDIYTKSKKFQKRNKSYHYINDSKNNFLSSPNEVSLESIKETQETPIKENLVQILKKSKQNISSPTKNLQENRVPLANIPIKETRTDLSLNNIDNIQNRKKKSKSFKISQANNKSLSPCNVKEEKIPKENIEKNNKNSYKEKEMVKSRQLAQLLKKQNFENHIVFRKISQSLSKNNTAYLQPNNNNPPKSCYNPIAEYMDFGISKNFQKMKKSIQTERKIKGILDSKDTTPKVLPEKNKGFSRKELSKRFNKKRLEV